MTDYSKLISGHGKVECSVCKKVLCSCRCFQCDGRVVETVCDECKDEKEGEDV